MKADRKSLRMFIRMGVSLLIGLLVLIFEPSAVEAEELVPNYSDEEVKDLPAYIRSKDGEITILYNPYSSQTAADLCNAISEAKGGELTDTYKTWSKAFIANEYEQLYCISDSEVYSFDKKGKAIKVEGTTYTVPIFSQISSAMQNHLDAIVGIKEVCLENEKRYVVIIAVRGTTDVGDGVTDAGVASKFISGSDGELYEFHDGFYDAACQLYTLCERIVFTVEGREVRLTSIIQDYLTQEESPFSMFITGHSLGAATVDLFSGFILDEVVQVAPQNYVTYAFAPPHTVYKKCKHLDGKNIFNFVNADDLVPTVPYGGNWIGKTITFTPTDEMRRAWYGDAYVKGKSSAYYKHLFHGIWDLANGVNCHGIRNYKKIVEWVNQFVTPGSYLTGKVLPNTTKGISVNESDLAADRRSFFGPREDNKVPENMCIYTYSQKGGDDRFILSDIKVKNSVITLKGSFGTCPLEGAAELELKSGTYEFPIADSFQFYSYWDGYVQGYWGGVSDLIDELDSGVLNGSLCQLFLQIENGNLTYLEVCMGYQSGDHSDEIGQVTGTTDVSDYDLAVKYGEDLFIFCENIIDMGDYYTATAQITKFGVGELGTEQIKISHNAVVGLLNPETMVEENLSMDEYMDSSHSGRGRVICIDVAPQSSPYGRLRIEYDRDGVITFFESIIRA